MIKPKIETDFYFQLLSITKNCETLVERTHFEAEKL